VKTLIALPVVATLFLTSLCRADTGKECSDIIDNLQRLTCYDNIFRAKDLSPAQQRSEDEQRFGAERIVVEPKKAEKITVSEISGTVVELSKKARGEYVFTLDNGQIWQQTEAQRKKFRTGIAVKIRKGSFGSYLLDAGKTGRTKVRRIK